MAFLIPDTALDPELVRSALHHVRARTGGNLLAAGLLAIYLGMGQGWSHVGRWAVGLGLGVAGLVAVDRALRRRVASREQMVRLLRVSAAFLGSMWGLVGVVANPEPEDLVGRAAILFFFASVSGASAVTNGALPMLFVAETVPMWSVGLIGISRGEPLATHTLILPVLFYIGVLAHHNHRLHRQIVGMHALRLHNEHLLEQLRTEQQLAREAWSQVSRQQEALMSAYDRANDLACRDGLTGILNRRCFFEALDVAVRDVDDHRGAFCVAVLDVDHFKQVNDVYGHATGDRALQAIAAELSAAVRVNDVVARIGGEEMAILFQGATATEATIAAERVRSRVEAIVFDDLPALRLTVSIGVSAAEVGTSGSKLVARADAAMYEAKSTGRNRVVVTSAMAA